MKYSGLAFKLFGKFTRGKKYPTLQESLRKALIQTSADIYVCVAILSALLAAGAGALIGLVLGLLLGLSLALTVLFVLSIGASLGGLTYFLVLYYPALAASERARKIDHALPYAASYMYTLSRSGTTIVNVFRELSMRPDMGEIQKEAQRFMKDVELLGRDPLSAIRALARSTPSEKFRNFLEVLVSIVETGGDVGSYFAGKVAEYHADMKDGNKKTVSTMELLAEIYIIAVQFLSLLMLAIVMFLGLAPGQPTDVVLIQLITYVWMPLGSLIFIILLAVVPPVELSRPTPIGRLLNPFRELPVVSGGEYDRRILEKLHSTMTTAKLKQFLRNPFRHLIQNPKWVLFLSLPAGFLYLLHTPLRTLTLCTAFFIMVVPYMIFYELRSFRATQLERALPEFIQSLSSASRSGLPLSRALQVTARTELGSIGRELERVGKKIQWGSSAAEALIDMEARVSVSPATARTVSLIRKASEAEEDISDVLDIVYQDVRTRQEIARERKSAMNTYRIVIFVCFAVFLVAIFFIVKSYVTVPTGMVAGEAKIEALPPTEVKLLFYRLLVLQSLFTGLIVGQIGGNILGGLKFVVLLMTVVVGMFEFIIMPMEPPVITAE
jgi:flagellar protein FlaJ